MEPREDQIQDQTLAESKQSVWASVTPFSKYLALVLFVLLPFLGGWVGYQYAPEKVVEVERIILKEAVAERTDQQSVVGRAAKCFGVYDALLEADHTISDLRVIQANHQAGNCIYEIAVETKNPNLCALIDESIRLEFYRLKNVCYQDVAELVQDESQCAFLTEHAAVYRPICGVSPNANTQILDGLIENEVEVEAISSWTTSEYFKSNGVLFDYPTNWRIGSGDTDFSGSFWFYSESTNEAPRVAISYGDVNHPGYQEAYIYIGRIYLLGLKSDAYVYKKQETEEYVFWVNVGSIKTITFTDVGQLGLGFIEEVSTRFRMVAD